MAILTLSATTLDMQISLQWFSATSPLPFFSHFTLNEAVTICLFFFVSHNMTEAFCPSASDTLYGVLLFIRVP